MRLLIDGYNLIFARAGHRFKIRDPVVARDQILSLLTKFKGSTGDEITVVFDGGHEIIARRQNYHGLTVLFSPDNSDADHLIMNLVSHDDHPRTITVVTSDNPIKAFVKRFGCEVEDVKQFLTRMEDTLKAGQGETVEQEPIEKFDGLSDEEVDFWMKYFDRDEPEEDEVS